MDLISRTIFNIPSFKKEYTITSEKDRQDIENGRCPDYALYWPEETNNQYWPPTHNYYKGFKEESNPKEDVNTYYKLWRQIATKIAEKKALNKPKLIIFCSLSLLVCDIDNDHHHTKLNLSKYGRQLWEVIKHLHPFIVVDKQHYTKEKKEWCKLKLETINIVTYDIIIKDEEDLENPFILIDYKDVKAIKNPKKIFIQYTNIHETLDKLLQNI
uniref:Uncharacterized protein n=1 Tax=viral metagenome TaxID=1070528 RepID=A0A6C0IFI4_9ZZZZ